jgi:hypothetical protein
MLHGAIHVRDKPNQGPKKELGFEGVASYFKVNNVWILHFLFFGCNHIQMNQH